MVDGVEQTSQSPLYFPTWFLHYQRVSKSIYIYIYIYIYVLFGPVKPELGVIPSGQENHSKAEHLNFPGRKLNVINFTEQ